MKPTALSACLLLMASAVLAQPSSALVPPLVRDGATVRLSDHVWVIPDLNVGLVPNVGIVVGTRATLVVDTGLGPRNGEAIVREMRKLSTHSEIYVVTTHSFTFVTPGIASAVTLLLGVVGIDGVIAYVVAQRRREVGIRMALGARASEVQRMFVTNGLVVTGIGMPTGIGIAVVSMRLLPSILFGVSPSDPLTYGAVFVGLAITAYIATWLPARQATSVDPSLALRGE
jgi:hypothetical protein